MESKAKKLTKTRFTLAAECLTKLFYVDKSAFENLKTEDAFLQSLAKGGFQVGALARCYFPDGIEIETLDRAQAVAATEARMAQTPITLFEPAFAFEDLFARIDILQAEDGRLRLFEVKAKSYSPSDVFFNRRPGKRAPRALTKEWMPYLLDVAFQTYLLRMKYPEKTVTPYLILADKTKPATVSGLNQRFVLDPQGPRTKIRLQGDTTPRGLGAKILSEIDVSEEVDFLLHGRRYGLGPNFEGETLDFASLVKALSTAFVADQLLPTRLGKHCGDCEFRRIDSSCDYGPCWEPTFSQRPGCVPVLEVWDGRAKDDWIRDGKLCIQDLSPGHLGEDKGTKVSGLSRVQRQWLQIEMAQSPSPKPYLDKTGLGEQVRSWKYPLHFIDFETIRLAIPFHSGRRPYETNAFQFSHHRVDADGRITHSGEFLHRVKGEFPNYAFLRALKAELENDDGTIFRYASHENTTLCEIVDQLSADESVPDRDALIAFAQSITHPRGDGDRPPGRRDMVDLLEMVKRFYLLPEMGGSNSLKVVLPTTLAASAYLRQKYSTPIYGTREMPSRNFKDHTWLTRDAAGKWENPYDKLPRIFEGFTDAQLASVEDDVEVKEGAGAMMAYAQMQLTDTSPAEIDALAAKLLRYCELDTLAMVMLWEAWQHWLAEP